MASNFTKTVLDRVMNGEDGRKTGSPIPVPVLTSSRLRTGFSETSHDSETKRNTSSIDEQRHTKHKFKLAVSAMNTACSICSKTSQSGVGGICKGCWTQFQAKGVRIGNMEEFNKFTESVKNNVSKIATGKDDMAGGNSQPPAVDTLRDLIPNIFFKDKHRKSIESSASKSLSVDTTDSGTTASKRNAPKLSGASSGDSDTSCTQSKSIETTRAEAADYSQGSQKGNSKTQSISRSKTLIVDPSRNNPTETDKVKLNEKLNTDTTRYADRKVTRTKTEFSLKGYNDRPQKSSVNGEPKLPDSATQGTLSENRDKSNENTTVNLSKVKRTESEHIDSWKIEKNSRKNINEKQKYEPNTIKESSKLSNSQTKVDGREKRSDSRYSHNVKQYDPGVHKKSNVKTNNRQQYDNTIKLGTRSMKGNALRQMAGSNGNKSSTDEDDDSDNKSGRIKDTYKPLNDIKVTSQNHMINTFKERLPKKQYLKEIKYSKSSKSSFDVQNKYNAYSQVNSEKTEDKKNFSSNDMQKTNESIYFSQRGLVATVSNFINQNDCFKNPKDGQSLTQFQKGAKELYYSTNISDVPRKEETPAIENCVPRKVNNFYFDGQPSNTSISDDYTAYKHGMNPAAANFAKAIESGDSTYHKSSTQSSDYYTDVTKNYSRTYTSSDSNHAGYSLTKSGNISHPEDDYYSGGFNGKSIGFENSDKSYTAPFATKSKGYIDWVDKKGSTSVGESYSGSGSSAMINPSSGNEIMYTGSSYETGLNQQMLKPIFHRPAETKEPILPILDRPTLVPSLESEAKESLQKEPTTQKPSRMFRKRNKMMDELIGQNIDSAGEFFSKAMVSFKNPFNNFNSNSNMWYGKERNALAGAYQDDMRFEKPNYTDWDPEIKPVFKRPVQKKAKEPLVLDFLKYEKENQQTSYREVEDSKNDDWYAGTEEGFHGPVNTTWDGKNWKQESNMINRPEDDDDDEEGVEYTEKSQCRICPNNNNSTELSCNINNNYPDYDKYDKPMVVPKKIAKPESMGNDRDYAPCLYSVPDRYVTTKQTPSPVNFCPPQSPPSSKYCLESSYFFTPQSNCDEEPEYAGYEKKREREIPKEPSPPPVPQVIKVGSILVRNNVENDFDYAENVNRDLNDESFGAMGFNQRSQELNSMPFPQATAATLMTEPNNLKQIIDVQQAIRRDWTNSKQPAPESLLSHLPSRSAPMKMDAPHQMEHEEQPMKKTSKNPKTRTTSVTSDAVHRRGAPKETSLDLEPIKKPTVPRMQSSNSSSSNSIKKPITPRVNTNAQKKQYTPRVQSNLVERPERPERIERPERPRSQNPRQLNYTSDLKKKERMNKDRQQQGLLWKVVSKPLKVCGIIREQK